MRGAGPTHAVACLSVAAGHADEVDEARETVVVQRRLGFALQTGVGLYALAMTGGPDEHEEVLAGGNMTAVVRVGDTVRRTAGPWTPTIHAFMHHLRASGFVMIPEPLGIDDRGREIISLLPGAPATYPLPDFAWSDATLTAVAETLRAFHDASVGFAPAPDGRWQWPAHEPAEVVCHNDFAPYNLMFEDGKLTGVIDLDVASPGPRVWDIAY